MQLGQWFVCYIRVIFISIAFITGSHCITKCLPITSHYCGFQRIEKLIAREKVSYRGFSPRNLETLLTQWPKAYACSWLAVTRLSTMTTPYLNRHFSQNFDPEIFNFHSWYFARSVWWKSRCRKHEDQYRYNEILAPYGGLTLKRRIFV